MKCNIMVEYFNVLFCGKLPCSCVYTDWPQHEATQSLSEPVNMMLHYKTHCTESQRKSMCYYEALDIVYKLKDAICVL